MTTMTANDHETLPSSVLESLLTKLLVILRVTQRPEGTSNARNKQDLLQAVSRSRRCGLHMFMYARTHRSRHFGKLSTTRVTSPMHFLAANCL